VQNQGRTPYERLDLTFWVDGGGRQHVRIPELRSAQSRSIKVRLRTPRGNRPEAIQVTTNGPHTNFAAQHEASAE
jgi:hypothetical protein